MEDFKVSVLVTFYNQVKYVDDALRSIIMQETSFPFQIIIGDDGSSDGTIEKIKKWMNLKPNIIKLVVQKRDNNKKYNKGVRASKNRLAILNQVDTPYFIFLDGDDYWTDKKKLQKQYEILENRNNRECVGCGHHIRWYNETTPQNIRLLPEYTCKEGKYTLEKYWGKFYFHTDTILFRSEFIKKIPLKFVKDSFNDNLITFCFLQFGPLYFVKDIMADYRTNDQGIWAGQKKVVGIVREFLMYDLEMKINPNIKLLCDKRHINDFIYFFKKKKSFSNIDKDYVRLAIKYDCTTTKRVLLDRKLFSNSLISDYIYVMIVRLLRKIDSVKYFFESNK